MKNWAILCAFVFLMMSCASSPQQRLADYEQLLNPYIGHTRSEVVAVLGAPMHTITRDGMLIYVYYHPVRVSLTSVASFCPRGPRSYRAYDQIRVYFENEALIRWDYYLQR